MCFFLACIDSVDITNYIEIIESVMSKPVYLLTVQEDHKEHNSLMDQIWVKYEQLKFGAVGTPAFKAEACELTNLLACVSQLLGVAAARTSLVLGLDLCWGTVEASQKGETCKSQTATDVMVRLEGP